MPVRMVVRVGMFVLMIVRMVMSVRMILRVVVPVPGGPGCARMGFTRLLFAPVDKDLEVGRANAVLGGLARPQLDF